jgi:hypothetical protein
LAFFLQKVDEMNVFEYYIQHAIPTGWQTVHGAFRAWRDLLTGNWELYAILGDDDPYEECREWFWQLLGEDNVYPREFLEYLQELMDRIDRGEEKLISLTVEDAARLDEILSELDDRED